MSDRYRESGIPADLQAAHAITAFATNRLIQQLGHVQSALQFITLQAGENLRPTPEQAALLAQGLGWVSGSLDAAIDEFFADLDDKQSADSDVSERG